MKARVFNIMQYVNHPETGEPLLSEDKIKLLNCLEIEWDYLYREASILCDELLSNYKY